MSESAFMRHGFGRLVLITSGSPPYPPPWPIRVFEIGEKNLVGVRYPDCRQVHSRSWWQKQIEQDAGKSIEGDPDAEQPEEPEEFVDHAKPVPALRKRGRRLSAQERAEVSDRNLERISYGESPPKPALRKRG